MSFKSQIYLTAAQVRERQARNRRAGLMRNGVAQPVGTRPHLAPEGESVFRPVPVEGATRGSAVGQVLICKLCNGAVTASAARSHIHHCWKVELQPDEPIPMLPTRGALLLWIAGRNRGV